MRTIYIVLAVILAVLSCSAQTQPPKFVAVMGTYQASSDPSMTGAGLFAVPLLPESGKRTYSFSEYDVYPQTWKPFVLNSVFRTGIYQEVLQYGNLRAGICGDIGGGTSGTATVGSFGGCGAAFFQLGKTKWHIAGVVSGVKTSLSDPAVIYKFGIRRDL